MVENNEHFIQCFVLKDIKINILNINVYSEFKKFSNSFYTENLKNVSILVLKCGRKYL